MPVTRRQFLKGASLLATVPFMPVRGGFNTQYSAPWSSPCYNSTQISLAWVNPVSHHNPRTVAPAICNIYEQNAGVPGSYACVGVNLVAKTALTGVAVTVSALSLGGTTLPATDLRTIKSSWRPVNGWIAQAHNNNDALMPWLLLHNDALITVDVANRTVTVGGQEKTDRTVPGSYTPPTHGTFSIADSSSLQTFSLAVNEPKALFLDTQIPNGTPAGDYTGTLTITASGLGTILAVPFLVRVHPFSFTINSRRLPGVYMEQRVDTSVTNANTPVGGLTTMSEGHFTAILNECFKSGINPTFYNTLGTGVPDAARLNLRKAMELRQAAGMGGWPYFCIGFFTGQYSQDASGKAAIKADTQTLIAELANYGGGQVYIYGRDEAENQLTPDEILYDGIHEAGGKTFVALDALAFSQMATPSKMDFPIIGGIQGSLAADLVAAEMASWAAVSGSVGEFLAPQAGACSPELYRLRYGLGLWAMGGDSPFTWGGTRYYNDAWNPFDHAIYSDETFLMPDSGPNIIPTLAWRGYREAVYDLRYMDTLNAAIAASSNAPVKAAAQAWQAALITNLVKHFRNFAGISLSENKPYQIIDPQQLRSIMVSYILAL